MDREFVVEVTSFNAICTGQAVFFKHVVSRLRKKFRILMFGFLSHPTLAAAIQVLVGYDDTRSTMVKGLNHLSFVKRHPFTDRTGEMIAADGIRAFAFF